MKKIDLQGKERCIHKKTFYGMVNGCCVKCGGWLSAWGKEPKSDSRKTYDDIKSILINSCPYWESDDKDDYMYILKKFDIENVANKLNEYIKKINP